MKIGLCGPMCSGKTTLAKNIQDKSYNTTYITSFAKKLKEIACDLFNMDINNKNRDLMQQLGSNMRNIDENVWINYTLKDASKYINVVIDDVRFENEVLLLKENNYILIKLNISKELQTKRLIDTYGDNAQSHINNITDISETSLNNINDNMYDLIIDVDNENQNDIILSFLKNKI